MCHACDTGNPKLLKLECNNCQAIFYQVDEPDKVEDLSCHSCEAGVGVEVVHEEEWERELRELEEKKL